MNRVLAAAVVNAERVEVYQLVSTHAGTADTTVHKYDFSGPAHRRNKRVVAGPAVEFFGEVAGVHHMVAEPLGALNQKDRGRVASILLDLDSYTTEHCLCAPSERYFLRYCNGDTGDVYVFLNLPDLSYTYICDSRKETLEVASYNDGAKRKWRQVVDTF